MLNTIMAGMLFWNTSFISTCTLFPNQQILLKSVDMFDKEKTGIVYVNIWGDSERGNWENALDNNTPEKGVVYANTVLNIPNRELIVSATLNVKLRIFRVCRLYYNSHPRFWNCVDTPNADYFTSLEYNEQNDLFNLIGIATDKYGHKYQISYSSQDAQHWTKD